LAKHNSHRRMTSIVEVVGRGRRRRRRRGKGREK
jgi:hypothetical protein